MAEEKKRIPLKDLNLTSRFLFDEVMEDARTHQEALSIIFGKEIPLLEHNETEKELRVSPYQALVDTNLLEPGIPNYNLLNESYIILIMPFDLFGQGKYQYTFKAKCCEVPDLILGDRATRIFLNTRGQNDNEVNRELIDFLHYVENTTDEVAEYAESDRIRRIHARVCKVKASEEVGIKYMQSWEEKYYEREEGRIEGAREKMLELVAKKLEKGQSVEEIADALEEDVQAIRQLISELAKRQ